jgi:hypothetical protein
VGGSAGAGAVLVRPARTQYTVWGLSLVGSRATGRHPGLPPDSGMLTRIAAVQASSCYRSAPRARVATSPARADRRQGYVSSYAARATGHSSRAGQRPAPVMGSLDHLLSRATVTHGAESAKRAASTSRRTRMHGPTVPGPRLCLRLSRKQDGLGRAAPGLQPGMPSVKVLF